MPRSGKVRRPGLLIYRDSSNEWRWRITAKNGNVIADSGEGYINKNDAFSGAHSSFLWLLQAAADGSMNP